ncbi:MAG: helix-hairpin-helix domain-containing protein [Defluviitaleaceae bacterium]|nr:helix-hairpin-helix domain-containing protein [Defluviitaleaceae bacterium]
MDDKPKRRDSVNEPLKTDLTKIPGIGERMARHLIEAGYPDIESLRGQSPEEVYQKDCLAQGVQVDRCALYCYRLAVAYAEGAVIEPDKLKWWRWKD